VTPSVAWSRAVINKLQAIDNDLFREAINVKLSTTGQFAPFAEGLFLEWLRGDEPGEVEASGTAPEEYASFLMTEWDLYGP